MLIPMHQPAYNQMCILYFVCCSAWRPRPNWCLSAAVVHAGQSTRLLHHSQGIQISFFPSLTPLINKACPAEKGLGTKAHRRPQAAPRAPSLRFPPRGRGCRPRPHGGGPGSWGPSPEPGGAPGPAAHPTAYFCPSRCHRPLSDERSERGANGLGGGRRRGWGERTAGRGVLPALPWVPATANRRQRRREAAHSAPRAGPEVPPSGAGLSLGGSLRARPWGAADPGWCRTSRPERGATAKRRCCSPGSRAGGLRGAGDLAGRRVPRPSMASCPGGGRSESVGQEAEPRSRGVPGPPRLWVPARVAGLKGCFRSGRRISAWESALL